MNVAPVIKQSSLVYSLQIFLYFFVSIFGIHKFIEMFNFFNLLNFFSWFFKSYMLIFWKILFLFRFASFLPFCLFSLCLFIILSFSLSVFLSFRLSLFVFLCFYLFVFSSQYVTHNELCKRLNKNGPPMTFAKRGSDQLFNHFVTWKDQSTKYSDKAWALFDRYFPLIAIMWRNQLILINCSYFC